MSKSYGALKVTNDVSFTLDKGEALGIIGPNGAGKTTLFNLVTGNVRPDAGTVSFNGRDVTHLPASARCHLGIGRSYQVPHPFGGMTVFENVLVGATFGAGHSEREGTPVAFEALRRTGLLPKANRLAGALPLLDRKRLELARALATEPDLLLLDEIAGGLTEHEVGALIEVIQDIRAEGTSIIWIEHIVHALLAVVDRLLVISFGSKLMEGDPAKVMASPEVQEIYLGIAVE
ncbi:MAG: ABC transporter ATP-binding protein [Thauera sp.]|nr:ABC transporter ATP-binding protein [Thauera sp.]